MKGCGLAMHWLDPEQFFFFFSEKERLQQLSPSLHPLVHCCSWEVCLSKWTWETLWIYLILQAIRLSRALLNMTWSVPAPEQTLLSPWPTRAVISQNGPWELTAVAFPKQITAAFGNTLRPRDLALTKTRAGAAAANALANALPVCVCVCVHLLPPLCVFVCLCLQGLMRFLSLFFQHLVEWFNIATCTSPFVSFCSLLSVAITRIPSVAWAQNASCLSSNLYTAEKNTGENVFSTLKEKPIYILDQYLRAQKPRSWEPLWANRL